MKIFGLRRLPYSQIKSPLNLFSLFTFLLVTSHFLLSNALQCPELPNEPSIAYRFPVSFETFDNILIERDSFIVWIGVGNYYSFNFDFECIWAANVPGNYIVINHNPQYVILRDTNSGLNFTSIVKLNASDGTVIHSLNDSSMPVAGVSN